MPVVSPSADESKSDWMKRCMSDTTMKSEYPEQDQRVAVCMGAWKDKKMTGNSVMRNCVTTLEARKDLIRNETLNNRAFTVAPVVAIVEGVHNSEFVSYEELTVWPEMWDGRPLPLDHPVDDAGHPITANSPDIIEKSVIGYLFNVVAREDIRGISGELWIDSEKAANIPDGVEVLRKLQAGEGLEVSTGYFTIIDNIPGEWENKLTGTVEKYTSSQYHIRPDHLALLPHDTGACSWKDGCGSPRINTDTSGTTVELQTTSVLEGATNMDKKSAMAANGKQLGRVLAAAIDASSKDPKAGNLLERLAVAAGIDTATVQSVVDGKQDFIPRYWIGVFAAVLDLDPYEVYMACSNDNSNARYSDNAAAAVSVEPVSAEPVAVNTQEKINIEKPVTAMTISDTVKVTDQIVSGCTPCQKTLKTKVYDFLQSIGLTVQRDDTDSGSVDVAVNKGDNMADEKKMRIDALIASDKNRFTEAQREWLTSLSDDQIALLEPAQVVAVPTVEVQTQPTQAQAQMSKEQILDILGVSGEDLLAAKALHDEKKAARNAKIEEIAAVDGCKFTKTELAAFSDALLDKTLAMLAVNTPFRVSPAIRRGEDNAVPKAPAILLAKPAGGAN